MRTTLDIDDDILEAAKERGHRERKSAGKVISELARQALTAPPIASTTAEPHAVYGLRPFPSRGNVITNEMINRIRDEDAY
jgi:hypothetical protein